MAEAPDQQIRECAYHLWEASGRPPGRDQEFWYQACEMLGSVRPKRRAPRKAQPARSTGRTSRRPATVASPVA